MKRKLIILALLTLLVAALAVSVSAASESDLTFTLNDDGNSYSVTDCNTGASGEMVIPATYNGKPVTGIGARAFEYCSSLTGVTIPDSVTSIGDYAFSNCSSLTGVYITDMAAWCGISFDNYYANPLNYAGNLYLNGELVTNLVIPESVTAIGGYAFWNCRSLNSVTIPDSVTSIGDYAFWNCSSLNSVTIPDSVTSIGESAFRDCSSLTDVYITDIGAWCGISFSDWWSTPLCYGKNLYLNGELITDLAIPKSVTSIGVCVFYGWNNLETVTIPDSVTSIGESAFEDCSSLTNMTIPDSVTSIGMRVFYGCSSLTSVTIPDSVTSIDRYVFNGCISLTSVTIPDNVTTIGDGAFAWCSSLTSVTIPDSVTHIGSCAFYRCNSLDHTFYGGTESQWTDISIGSDNSNLTDATRHYNMEGYTQTGCTVKGVYCSLCEETLIAGDEHSYESGICTICGGEEPIVKFDMRGSSMTLGNPLEINFAVAVDDLTGENNYIVVSKEYADGSVVTQTYPQSEWVKQSSKINYISFSVTAKEMNDKLTAIVYNENGRQISNTYEDSVAGYCLRKLAEEEEEVFPADKDLTLYVDMLNYGAAAQTRWNYNTDDLANAGLTEEQCSYATVVTEKDNILQKGEGYYGTSLSLKDNILMNVAYEVAFLADVAYAVVTFVDHNGNDESVTVAAQDFIAQGTKIKYISLECMAVADYAQPVTIQLYNAAGECISTTIDSMGSYAGRQTKDVYLYEAILAFGMGAYNYFHS